MTVGETAFTVNMASTEMCYFIQKVVLCFLMKHKQTFSSFLQIGKTF